jgi:acyl-CoA synthetase (AMP-forming)/AMP-acid ligase II
MAFWLFSGGSTGFPKGVVHLHHDIPYTCETYAREILQISEHDITFSSTKLYHAYGLGNNLTFPYWVGATTVLRPGRPDPKGLLETAQQNRPTLFFSVPTLSAHGWESAQAAQQRVVSAVDDCLRQAPVGEVAVVAHGGVGTLLWCHLAGQPISRRHDQPGQGSYYSIDIATGRPLSGWQRLPLPG